MRSRPITLIFTLVLAFFLAFTLPAEEGDEGLSFDMNLGLGVSNLPDPDNGGTTSWQSLRLQPEIGIGKFGIGLDLTVNFRFTDGSGNSNFQIREEDWVPNEELGTTFLDLYLPIFSYVRYGEKGEPIYAKIGTIGDAVLGNGFIVGNYSNENYLPKRRVVGLTFDLDGALFDFPYLGMETFVANLAAWNLLGARVYVRPLAWLDVPVLNTAQLGFTIASDLNPFYYEEQDFKALKATNPAAVSSYEVYWDGNDNNDPEAREVTIYGVDLRVPIVSDDAISLAAFTDLVFQNKSTGWMIGFGGKLLGALNYGAQIRVLGENFLPVYFDQNYDLFRMAKWEVFKGNVALDPYAGWFATLGLSLADNLFNFNVSVESAFANPDNLASLSPTLRGSLSIARDKPEVLGGFSLAGWYEKRYIQDAADLVSPENAVIGMRVGYQTGVVELALVYDLRYNPNSLSGDPWEITSRIDTTISF